MRNVVPLATGVTIAVIVFASLWPIPSAWGVNHLSYFPGGARALLIALCIASTVPALRRRGARPIETAHGRAWQIGAALLFFVLCIAFRSATQLWGDGELMASIAEVASTKGGIWAGAHYSVYHDPLAPGIAVLHSLLGRVGLALGMEVRTSLAMFHAVLGGLWAWLTLRWIGSIAADPITRTVVAILLFTSGAIVVFFGYLEDYTSLFVLATAVALLSHLYLAGRVSLVPVVVLVLVAVVFHVLSVLMIPGVAFLVAARSKDSRRTRRTAIVIVALSVLLGVGAKWIPGISVHYRPIFGGHRALTSPGFLYSALNLLFLFIPQFLILVGLWLAGRRCDESAPVKTNWLAVVAIVPFAILFLLFKPDLGMARDWDIFALLVPFLVMAFVPAIERARSVAAAWLLPIAVIGVVQAVGWIGVHASATRSESRYRQTLVADRSHVGYGHEVLAEYFERRGRNEEAFEAWRDAHAAYGNTRYAYNAATKAAELGRVDDAIELMRRCLLSDPSHSEARANLASYLVAKQDFVGVVAVTREGLELEPDNTYYNVFLGMALFETRQFRDAHAQLERCLELNLPPDMKSDVTRAIQFIERNER
jgi:hypothetical protein